MLCHSWLPSYELRQSGVLRMNLTLPPKMPPKSMLCRWNVPRNLMRHDTLLCHNLTLKIKALLADSFGLLSSMCCYIPNSMVAERATAACNQWQRKPCKASLLFLQLNDIDHYKDRVMIYSKILQLPRSPQHKPSCLAIINTTAAVIAMSCWFLGIPNQPLHSSTIINHYLTSYRALLIHVFYHSLIIMNHYFTSCWTIT